jgi:transaldolase
MRFFLDTANLDEIRKAVGWGVICGVTTNPTLVAREGAVDFHTHVKTIAEMVDGPVSAEVVSVDKEGMVREARELARIHSNVVVKIPMTPEGMGTVKVLSSEGIRTNVTLVFSVNQALLAAAAGATFVSPFVGRIDDVGHDGMEVIREIVDAFSASGTETQVLAASIRHSRHVSEAALAGADVATVPFAVLEKLFRHPLTDRGVERFLADWEEYRRQNG